VGKVYINLVREFQNTTGVEPILYLTKPQAAKSVESPLGDISQREIPFTRVQAELLWRTFSAPVFDRWTPDCSWLFCPRELWVPTRKLKYAITVHDVYPHEPEFATKSWRGALKKEMVLKKALRRADLIVAVSEFTKNRLIELFRCDADRIIVAHNAVEPSYLEESPDNFSDVPELGGAPYVLAIGGLRKKKGATAQIALARELAKRNSELRLLVLGPVDPEYEGEVRGLTHLVRIDRGMPNERVKALVRNARVSVLLSEYEGFGIPLLEGMACGTPVLGANRASLPEVLGNDDYTVNPNDSAEMVDRIEALHLDQGQRDNAIAWGKHRVTLFSWAASAQKIIAAMKMNS